MVGYSIHPPFIGQVEGKHPSRLVDEDGYRAGRGRDAEIADRVLTDPKSAERTLGGIDAGELRRDL